MIYICKDCGKEIKNLRTDGDEICDSFACPECIGRTASELRKEASELAKTLHTRYHMP